jgi:hypothetical protein
MMPSYRCRSHDRSDCRDVVCRRQAERAGLVTPPAPRAARGSVSTGKTAASSAGSATAQARARARSGELWLGPTEVYYSASGQVTGSTAHLPGPACNVRGENADSTGLFQGWGRVEHVPDALADLVSGKPVMATDGSGLMATRLCQSCRTILG